jgi:hypothetical protein
MGDLPASGLIERLKNLHRKNQLVTKCFTGMTQAWDGFIWLRIGISGGYCERGNETLDAIKG